MDFSSLEELFRTRRSIRSWKIDAVPEELLKKAINAAFLSPNSGGKQPYKCYVITNKDKIAEIGRAMQDVTDYLASLRTDAVNRKEVERWQEKSAFFAQAPVLIAVSATIYQNVSDKLQACNMDQPRVAKINEFRKIAGSRIQTVGAFVAHLLLSFHALGLGAVWMVGPAQAKDTIEKIIGMSEKEDFVALVPVGYPDENPTPPAYKPFDEIVAFIR